MELRQKFLGWWWYILSTLTLGAENETIFGELYERIFPKVVQKLSLLQKHPKR